MSREAAIARATDYFDSGAFRSYLARRVAIPSESQSPERAGELKRYLDDEMKPLLQAMGFPCRLPAHAKARGPFLFAERIEEPTLPTVLYYGHGDVIRGMEGSWKGGLHTLATRRGRRVLLGSRDCRQQGPAQHQHRCPRPRPAHARPPRL